MVELGLVEGSEIIGEAGIARVSIVASGNAEVASLISIVGLVEETRMGGGGACGTRATGGGVIDGRCVSGVIFLRGDEKALEGTAGPGQSGLTADHLVFYWG